MPAQARFRARSRTPEPPSSIGFHRCGELDHVVYRLVADRWRGGQMQACQVCGTAEVDAGGYCTGCRHYRGPQSYALIPPAADLPMAGPAVGIAAPQSDPGAVYYSAPGYAQATYPV